MKYTSRRSFLKSTATLSLGALALQSQAKNLLTHPEHPLGLQLFTFFNEIDNDVQGTLQKIADVGFKEIESAFSKKGGYYGMKPKEFAAYIQSLGMKWQSHHVLGAPFKLPPNYKLPVDAAGKPLVLPQILHLRDNMQQVVDEAAEGGVAYLVCANTPTNTLDEVKQSIEVLNKTYEACHKAGIGFAYHNHDFEFHDVEGKIPYEMMLAETTVQMELDIAWTIKGKKDPVELFKQYPGRFPLWHMKDLDASHEKILPVGSGTIDYKRVFAAADIAGVKHIFIEHDMPEDPLASIRSSYDYVKNNLNI